MGASLRESDPFLRIGSRTRADIMILWQAADFVMAANIQSEQVEESILQVYLLGIVDFETFLPFQRRLQYEITSNRQHAALVLCEHPPIITVGRQGSRGHIRLDAEYLRQRRWQVRWVQRG